MSFGGPVRDKWITARNANNRHALPASGAVRCRLRIDTRAVLLNTVKLVSEDIRA